jgi:dihydrolipoamide dehydrogenase
MIYGAALAIENQLRLQDMEQVIFPHPTVSEIFRETIFSFHE